MGLAATSRAQPVNTMCLASRPSLSQIKIAQKWAQLSLGQFSGRNQLEMQGLSTKCQRLSTQRMIKDALSARLALSKRTDCQKKISKLFFSPFLKEFETLISILQNKLIYPNVMIMKQVPHYALHKRKEKQKLELGCLPGSAFLPSLA